MGCAPRRNPVGSGVDAALSRLSRPPTQHLETLFCTFHSIPPPRHFLQKTESTGTCLKETAHLSALKGSAAALHTPSAARGPGRGEGTAAQRLCGKSAFSISFLPCCVPSASPGFVPGWLSRQISSSQQGRDGSHLPRPLFFGLFLCHVDEIIGLGVLGVLFDLSVPLTTWISAKSYLA